MALAAAEADSDAARLNAGRPEATVPRAANGNRRRFQYRTPTGPRCLRRPGSRGEQTTAQSCRGCAVRTRRRRRRRIHGAWHGFPSVTRGGSTEMVPASAKSVAVPRAGGEVLARHRGRGLDLRDDPGRGGEGNPYRTAIALPPTLPASRQYHKCARDSARSLPNNEATCVLTVLGDDEQGSAMALLDRPSATSARTSRSRSAQRADIASAVRPSCSQSSSEASAVGAASVSSSAAVTSMARCAATARRPRPLPARRASAWPAPTRQARSGPARHGGRGGRRRSLASASDGTATAAGGPAAGKRTRRRSG